MLLQSFFMGATISTVALIGLINDISFFSTNPLVALMGLIKNDSLVSDLLHDSWGYVILVISLQVLQELHVTKEFL